MTNPLYDTLFGRHEGREAPFIIRPDGGQIGYAAFLDRAARIGAALVGLGVQPGDRVAAQVTKSPDAIGLYAACARIGAVFLPLNTAYTPDEVAYFVTDSGAGVFVCDGRDEAAL